MVVSAWRSASQRVQAHLAAIRYPTLAHRHVDARGVEKVPRLLRHILSAVFDSVVIYPSLA